MTSIRSTCSSIYLHLILVGRQTLRVLACAKGGYLPFSFLPIPKPALCRLRAAPALFLVSAFDRTQPLCFSVRICRLGVVYSKIRKNRKGIPLFGNEMTIPMLELELVSNTRRVFEPGTRYAGSVQLCSHRSGHAASWACHEQGTEQTSSIERFNLLHSSSSFSINNTTVRLPSQQRCTGAHLPFFGGTRCTLLISRDGRVVCARQDSKHIVLHISKFFCAHGKNKIERVGGKRQMHNPLFYCRRRHHRHLRRGCLFWVFGCYFR